MAISESYGHLAHTWCAAPPFEIQTIVGCYTWCLAQPALNFPPESQHLSSCQNFTDQLVFESVLVEFDSRRVFWIWTWWKGHSTGHPNRYNCIGLFIYLQKISAYWLLKTMLRMAEPYEIFDGKVVRGHAAISCHDWRANILCNSPHSGWISIEQSYQSCQQLITIKCMLSHNRYKLFRIQVGIQISLD